MPEVQDHPWLVVLALLLVPAALGAALGAALRRRTRRAAWVGPAVGAAALAATWAALPRLLDVSPYDALGAAALFAAALTLATLRPLASVPPAARALSAAILALGVAGLELRARALPPPMFAPSIANMQPLWVSLDFREFGTPALFPDRFQARWVRGLPHRRDWERTAGRRRVLHLGDSMVDAGDAPDGLTFVDLLSHDTGEDHVNMGVSNTGTDFHLQMFREWVRRANADAVVLHLFTGNDPEDIDRPYLYCAGAPLLGDAARGLPFRCPTPRWRVTRLSLLAAGPPPYALRILSTRSALALQAMWRFELLLRSLRNLQDGPSPTPRWARMGEILRALAAESARARVPVVVSVLPFYRAVLEPGAEPGVYQAKQARAVALARAAGLRTLDPLDDLRAAMQARPGARWFLPPSPHFDVDGHRWYASWLRAQLGPGATGR
jgi:hypothetical protein